MLEGDGQIRKRKRGWMGSYGNVWDVIQGFEFLLDKLEDYNAFLTPNTSGLTSIWVGRNLISTTSC